MSPGGCGAKRASVTCSSSAARRAQSATCPSKTFFRLILFFSWASPACQVQAVVSQLERVAEQKEKAPAAQANPRSSQAQQCRILKAALADLQTAYDSSLERARKSAAEIVKRVLSVHWASGLTSLLLRYCDYSQAKPQRCSFRLQFVGRLTASSCERILCRSARFCRPWE